jgi:hypothetical protein
VFFLFGGKLAIKLVANNLGGEMAWKMHWHLRRKFVIIFIKNAIKFQNHLNDDTWHVVLG